MTARPKVKVSTARPRWPEQVLHTERQRHWFMYRDVVQRQSDGVEATVVDAQMLYATIEWDDGTREEIEQHDRRYVVTLRPADIEEA